MNKQAEYVLRTVEERGIRFVRLWFTDVQGVLKSVSISPAELEVAFEEGMTFDGSAIDGYARIQEADMLAKPDPGGRSTPPPACSVISTPPTASLSPAIRGPS
jgi:glutamine synthetase